MTGSGPARPLADVVLGVPTAEHPRRLPLAVLLALAFHAGLFVAAPRWRSQEATPRVEKAITLQYVDLVAPAPPVEKPADPPPAAPPRPRARVSPRPPASPAAAPAPAAAAAGAIVAQEVDPSAPVDLSGEVFVTGTATGHTGGVTAREATGAGDPTATTSDHATGVSLEDPDWSCPWPREADAEQIDQQTVVIRVLVDRDGHATSAVVVVDPGNGFGEAAVACALRTRFRPAHDRDGAPISARSPDVRVRFTRR